MTNMDKAMDEGEEDHDYLNGNGHSHHHNSNTASQIQQHFSHHLQGIARINNGSFGCCPHSVLAAHHEWHLRFLRQPDKFYSDVLPDALLHSRSLLKSLINADYLHQVSLIDNATTAAAIVLRHISTSLSRNDTVVMFNCAFQAVKKSIQAYVATAGASVVEIPLPFPVRSPQEIVARFRKGLQRGKANGSKIRLAIIDHITSMPSVLIPVGELVRICREEGVDQVFVDAAHALGTVPVDVKEIGADFYVTNLHKWFFCPPSVAVFYSRNELPIETSWIGTRDYSSQLLVPSVMEFVSTFEGGLEGIMKRNHERVVQMGQMLIESWGTILGSPPHMCASMIMVGLPSQLGISSEDNASKLRSHLRTCYGVEVPIHYQAPEDDAATETRDNKNGLISGYARISHQVYNTVEDYHKFRDAINQLVQDGKVCKML
ncbi:L-cysteine desulfhydrase [Cannabis sativa]|nr:L-cysteine desulfhydrase [Cannabis sativa]